MSNEQWRKGLPNRLDGQVGPARRTIERMERKRFDYDKTIH